MTMQTVIVAMYVSKEATRAAVCSVQLRLRESLARNSDSTLANFVENPTSSGLCPLGPTQKEAVFGWRLPASSLLLLAIAADLRVRPEVRCRNGVLAVPDPRWTLMSGSGLVWFIDVPILTEYSVRSTVHTKQQTSRFSTAARIEKGQEQVFGDRLLLDAFSHRGLIAAM